MTLRYPRSSQDSASEGEERSRPQWPRRSSGWVIPEAVRPGISPSST
ncbi:hypothetical protein [Nesterenkonia jeotgali]|uniref:Uncharacterized protein n=1 Tax=Nesterenkonia jeotgali TaxID=317018 RepID=A0A839FRQ1_9MICC|nr:hypothetical protein [Nesterenkonia jeotgali]MBA8922085.1 hypothetical protein [Nesterenkonia jeotgali]